MSVTRLDTSIFDRVRTSEEARRARRLENIYHVGQHKIWDGRETLAELVEKHGGVNLDSYAKKEALARVLSGLMWGELAAWKIAAQLADQLDDYEAKVAATSQAHDEARHFYVLHDYLELLGVELPPLDRATRYLLEMVVNAPDVSTKLIGMQLFVETMALTLFKTLRDLDVEPVLSALMILYERDEARHVGLGVQHAPEIVARLKKRELARLVSFQTRLFLAALVSLKRTAWALEALDVDPREIADAGRRMFDRVIGQLTEANGGAAVGAVAGPVVVRTFEATKEVMFPLGPDLRGRLKNVGRALLYDTAA